MWSPIILSLTAALTAASPILERQTATHNNFACRSTVHPNPVILFHGLGATYYEDLNYLEAYLQINSFCTFSITYGAFPGWPYVGGLEHIDQSAAQLATFVNKVKQNTGASKVDFVGHSEGAFQTLYVTKFEGVSSFVDKIFAIAPPTHGTSFANLYNLSYFGGNLTNEVVKTILDDFGCPACDDLVDGGAAVEKLNNGPIAQSGVSYTILASKDDELVTPTYTAFVNETSVRNIYVQDYCPNDPVGHIGEAYDQNVWALVLNTLSGSTAGPTTCVYGSPGR
ncbi:Lipase (class 2) [Teratosphaeria destructans]|uniref:Lipase (Class 2) n=1 Tax=Teratosphaeria destructans TaxID=418781 RepID=A0A9W7W7V2_9PEZI|nr:Lipase (class 2) [Teratosphaeria destructans]